MGLLVEGKWVDEWYEADEKGRFVRPSTQFRNRVQEGSDFPPEAGRYHLYVSYACPWAHRTLILRKLKGLEDAISLSVVDPYMGENGWAFSDYPDAIRDSVNGADYMHQVYTRAVPDYTGRVTVPVLWDKERNAIVNNESREIMRMFDKDFNAIAKNPDVDFCPEDLREQIDRTLDAIYEPINNGVYRSGFAVSQKAYDEAVTELFAALDHWDAILGKQRYLCGNRITEADWAMFTTLVRFDPVYVGHFKCNLRRIADYPNLWNYVKDLYQQPGVAETCNFDHIKSHYYRSHAQINPTRIVPRGPIIDFSEPHDRARLG